MNTTLKNVLGVVGILTLAGLLLTLGIFWGRMPSSGTWFGTVNPGMTGGYGPGMMGGQNWTGGMMGGYGSGMMNGFGPGATTSNECPFNQSGWSYGQIPQTGFGMMGGYGPGMMTAGCPALSGETLNGTIPFSGMGMMGGYGANMMWDNSENTAPLSIEENNDILESFLSENGWEDQFDIADIMVFSNHAYAQLIERETGLGAYEVLIGPATGTVFPEHGANMMWNTKYGMHTTTAADDVMAVNESEAIELAQAELNNGFTVDDHGTAFYGYYTFHILEDGLVTGMLSVNGFTGEVLIHTWHGDLIEYDTSDH
jgi:hypothetical protein